MSQKQHHTKVIAYEKHGQWKKQENVIASGTCSHYVSQNLLFEEHRQLLGYSNSCKSILNAVINVIHTYMQACTRTHAHTHKFVENKCPHLLYSESCKKQQMEIQNTATMFDPCCFIC